MTEVKRQLEHAMRRAGLRSPSVDVGPAIMESETWTLRADGPDGLIVRRVTVYLNETISAALRITSVQELIDKRFSAAIGEMKSLSEGATR